jgi:thioredoxin reductase
MLDVLIVGGGPAGLSAALVLGRCRRRVLLCDAGSPRNARSQGVHGFLSRDGIEPAELRRLGREQLLSYPNVAVREGEVVHAGCDGGQFSVLLTGGVRLEARKLLLAPGIIVDLPEIPGFSELYGRGVFDCPYCDGWEVRDQPLVVYGREGGGMQYCLQLLGWSKDITFCTDGPSGLSGADQEELVRNGIGVVEKKLERLEGEELLRGVRFADADFLACRAVFFKTQATRASPILTGLGCDLTETGSAKTGEYENTGIPGLYVAGDASKRVDFAIVAAAEGAMAAFAINRELLKESLETGDT